MNGPTKADLLAANAELHATVEKYEQGIKSMVLQVEAAQKASEPDPEALALSRCIKALDKIAPTGASYGTSDRDKRAAVQRVLDHLAAKYVGGTP